MKLLNCHILQIPSNQLKYQWRGLWFFNVFTKISPMVTISLKPSPWGYQILMKSMDSAKVEILDQILVKCVSCNRRRPTPRKLKPKMTRSLRNYEKIQKIRNHAFENSAKVWGTVPESQDPKVELLHPKLSNSDRFLEKVKQNLKEIMYISQKSQFSHP